MTGGWKLANKTPLHGSTGVQAMVTLLALGVLILIAILDPR